MAPKEPRKKLDPGVWREARDIMWLRRRLLAFGFVLMMVSSAASLILPFLLKRATDDFIDSASIDLLYVLAFAFVGATLVQSASSFALSQMLGVTAQRAVAEMRKSVHRHVTRLPIAYFDSVKTGELISRVMSDAEGIRNLVGTGLVQLTKGLFTSSIALVLLFWINWRMTAVVLVAVVLFGAGMAYAFMKLRPLFRRRGLINAQVTGRLGETLGGIRIVKAYTSEKREELIFAKGIHRLFRNVARTITATSAVMSLTRVLFGALGAVMMVIGINAIVAGDMTAGDMVAYTFLTGLVAAPMIQITSIGTQLSEAFAGLDRIREVKRRPTEDAEDADREPIVEMDGDLAFEGVCFEYDEGVPVLKGVTFEAPAGTTTALVGSSGSGKSTLIGLVMAFHRPGAGRILIDGRDLAGLRLRDYRAHLGIVLQDNFLFDGTIAANIAYGTPRATREQIEEAGRVAHCEQFVLAFEEGYDSLVGERGVKLSGGQRQRIAIARAILADPRVLILDEATSSLDSESEAMIQDGLRRLREGRTTFVIAHRLSTIQASDQILVLEEGEIVERGTHEELLAADGRYRTLYDKQYKFEANRFINPGEDFTPEPDRPQPPPPRRRRGPQL